MNIEKICADIYEWASTVYSELGSGFNENILQAALAVEFRENKIKYLREPHIEIFYKDHSLGLDRPDFILLPAFKRKWEMNESIILETKVSLKLSDENRQQLKSYLISLQKNKNTTFQKTNKGILLNFLKTEEIGVKDSSKNNIETEFWTLNRISKRFYLTNVLPRTSR